MRQRALRSPLSSLHSTLSIPEFEAASQDWLYDCEFRQHSKDTIATRRILITKFLWVLRYKGLDKCGTSEIRQFLSYCTTGHNEPGGRWGNPRLTKPLSARTVKDYHCHLKSLFNYLVGQEVLEASPMERIASPISRGHQIQPLTVEQVTSLFKAAEDSDWPRRNCAILAMMIDSGLRASELCGLKWKDVDLKSRRCVVLGKGNKSRSVFFGLQTAKLIFRHQQAEHPEECDPVFRTRDGILAGAALTRSGLRLLIGRLGRKAGIKAIRCSPHSLRHTFAVSYLRNGGQAFGLMHTLGHTNLQMTQRYVMMSQNDLQAQHATCSPMDNLKRGSK